MSLSARIKKQKDRTHRQARAYEGVACTVSTRVKGRKVKLVFGDCIAALKQLDADSIDTIVTDPPYHLTAVSRNGSPRTNNADMPHGRHRLADRGFMGKRWDGGDIAFQPETWAAALRVLKPGGHLLTFSGTRTYHRMACAIEDAGFEIKDMIAWLYGSGFPKHAGSLKPAHEPICFARKPAGRVAPLNIDGCRIGKGKGGARNGEATAHKRYTEKGSTNYAMKPGPRGGAENGRWPANVVHDGSDEVVGCFPDAPGQQGDLKATGRDRPGHGRLGKMGPPLDHTARVDDTKSASRFFYCAKTSKKERGEKNTHPTVKPIDLMRYLCRLVTPTGGVVLDPFMGSGTTGIAAVQEGFDFIGVEREQAYFKIAQRRVKGA